MLIIVGSIVVTLCVFGGFAIHGGNVLTLWQPNELLIIGGAGVGAMLTSAPIGVIKAIVTQILHALTGKDDTKESYMELLMLLFELVKTAKGNLLGLEAHVENPEQSDIFKKYPGVLKHHHLIEFIADTLKVQISSPVSPYDLEELMDKDLDAAHKEEYEAPILVAKLAGAMPGLGIVAAVLGVVYTMGKLTEGKEVIGHSVAAALVGTFIGILLCYGFMEPMAHKMEIRIKEEGKRFDVVKAALLAFAKDCSPKVCVEFARRTVPPSIRPTFAEVDTGTQSVGKKAA